MKASTILTEATPTIGTAAYADGDRVGTLMAVKTGVDGKHGATLLDLKIIDLAAQKSALNIWFFSKEITVDSADNAALDIDDDNILFALGHVVVAATDYVDTASNAVATVKNIGLGGLKPHVTGENGTVYALIESAGTPTYTATDSLRMAFYVAPDTN